MLIYQYLDDCNCWQTIINYKDWRMIRILILGKFIIYLGYCQINDEQLIQIINKNWP